MTRLGALAVLLYITQSACYGRLKQFFFRGALIDLFPESWDSVQWPQEKLFLNDFEIRIILEFYRNLVDFYSDFSRI